jgi:glycerol-3-phosphate O-acyltransferase
MQRYPELVNKDMRDLYAHILDPAKYEQFLAEVFFSSQKEKAEQIKGLANFPTNAPGTVIMLDINHAKLQLKRMNATIDKRAIQLSMAYFNRKFRQLSSGIYVQQSGVDTIKKLIAANERVILLPVYKSFADLPILLYTLFVNKIEIPFTIGNLEDTPRVPLFDSLLKRLGYILTKRSRDQSLQWSYTNQAVLRELINKYRLVMMFQNDVRIRSGKFNQPTSPDITI